MKPNTKSVLSRIILICFITCSGSAGATVLVHDDFEDSLGNWSIDGSAFLYNYSGTGINLATIGSGAAAIPAGFDAGILTLTNSLRLHSNQATNITISFNYEWDETSATRYVCIDYSLDGGRTWTDGIGDINSWGSFTGMQALGSFSKTLDEKSVGSFTDKFKFRLRGRDGGKAVTAFIDEIKIIGADVIAIPAIKDDIPEPSSLLLVLSASSLAMLRLRRRNRAV